MSIDKYPTRPSASELIKLPDSRRERPRWLLPGAGAVAAILTAGGITFGIGHNGEPKNEPRTPDVPTAAATADPGMSEQTPTPSTPEAEAPIVNPYLVPVEVMENDPTGSKEVEQAGNAIIESVNEALRARSQEEYEQYKTAISQSERFSNLMDQLYYGSQNAKLNDESFSIRIKVDVVSTTPAGEQANFTLNAEIVAKNDTHTYSNGTDPAQLSGENTWVLGLSKEGGSWAVIDFATPDL